MTNALFKVTRQDPTVYVANDGQHWNSDMDARRYNARIAMLATLGRVRRDRSNDVTFVRNVAAHMPPEDVDAVIATLRAYLEKVKPQIMAIPDPVGWVKENGRQVRYPINLPWNDTSDSREAAARDTLIELLCWMADGQMANYLGRDAAMDGMAAQMELPTTKLSRASVKAFCNSSQFSEHPECVRRDMTRLSYVRGIQQYVSSFDARGRIRPGQEENLLAAFEAAAQALATPVTPS